jgi:hypothetical protein
MVLNLKKKQKELEQISSYMRPSTSKLVKLTMVTDKLKPASYNWHVLFNLFACWFLYRNTRWH